MSAIPGRTGPKQAAKWKFGFFEQAPGSAKPQTHLQQSNNFRLPGGEAGVELELFARRGGCVCVRA